MILMQAIRTRSFGPTNTRPARMIADCKAGRIVLPYEDMLGIDANHKAAAVALRDKLGWHHLGVMSGGSFKQDGFWLFTPADEALVAGGAAVLARGNMENFKDLTEYYNSAEGEWAEFGLEIDTARAYVEGYLKDIVLVAGAIQKQMKP